MSLYLQSNVTFLYQQTVTEICQSYNLLETVNHNVEIITKKNNVSFDPILNTSWLLCNFEKLTSAKWGIMIWPYPAITVLIFYY